MAEDKEALIEIIEDLVGKNLFDRACAVCQGATWFFGNRSNDEHDLPFWKMDLDGDAAFDEIWRKVQPQCEALVGCKLRVIRQYANGHTYGLGGQPHLDDLRPGTFTLLYYPMPEWNPAWQGETVFHDQTGEIAVAVTPRPNRAVLFDARIPHAGRAPSRSCPALRVTVAYKLEAVAETEIKAPPVQPVQIEMPSANYALKEESRDGAQRTYLITSSAEKVTEQIDARLLELGKTVRLPGYRPGKISLDVLAKRYGTKTRQEVLQKITEKAAAEVLGKGGIAASLELLSGAEMGDVCIQLIATHLADLPEPPSADWTLEKWVIKDPKNLPEGFNEEEATAFLSQHFQKQALDHLHQAFSFSLAKPLILQELTKILSSISLPENEAEKADLLESLQHIAERRVKLGAILAELARRHRLVTQKNDPSLEARVIEWLISQTKVTERIVKLEDWSTLLDDEF